MCNNSTDNLFHKKKMLVKVVKPEPMQDKLNYVDSDSVNPNKNLYDGHSSLSLST